MNDKYDYMRTVVYDRNRELYVQELLTYDPIIFTCWGEHRAFQQHCIRYTYVDGVTHYDWDENKLRALDRNILKKLIIYARREYAPEKLKEIKDA